VTESLTRTRPRKPESARVAVMHVVAAARLSPGFVRVTLRTDPDVPGSFAPMGYDQWFRLFLPTPEGRLDLPHGDAEGWYTRWLALEESGRCLVRNYTVRAARPLDDGWEIDVDFVVHLSAAGTVDGVAAAWALAARPGDTVGMLDQGVIFAEPETTTERILVLADETGLPGVEGIARSIAAGTGVTALLEVPHSHDQRELPTAAVLDVRWVVRDDHSALPGRAALTSLDAFIADAGDSLAERAAYCYVVGEASFVLEARTRLRAAGVPKDAIDFCAYWRPERRA
jgi:NADPH-dependent ferric siderophore reductase